MTKDIKRKEIKVGLITLLGIILLIIGISLGNNISFSTSEHQLTFQFQNSAGIELSSPVFVNGVKRGKVTAINPFENGVRIEAAIDRIDDLKSDLTASISMTEITGGKKIDIYPGTATTKYDGKSIIIGYTNPDMSQMIAMLGDMGKEAQSLLKKLDTLTTTAIKLTSNKQETLNNTIDNTAQMIETLNAFIQKNTTNLQKTINNLTQLTADLKNAYNKYEPKVDKISSDLELTLKETKQLISNTEKTIQNANDLILELKKITNDIQNDSNLVNKLLYDKNFAKQIDSTLTNLQILLKTINEHGVNVNVRLGTRP